MERSLRAMGKTIIWSPAFKEAMQQLCAARGLPDDELPLHLGAAPLKPEGVLLVWPCGPRDAGGHVVSSSPQGRRVITNLAEPFIGLGAHIPDGLATEIPFTTYRSSAHGLCLALQFQKATFLYKQSRGSAIGLQDEWE